MLLISPKHPLSSLAIDASKFGKNFTATVLKAQTLNTLIQTGGGVSPYRYLQGSVVHIYMQGYKGPSWTTS